TTMSKSKLKILLVCLLLGLTVANFASAALVTCGGYTEAGEKQTACTVKDILFTIERIINFLLAWAWLVSIAFILWGAYNMVTSAGNEEAIADGKLTFKNAVVGFFLVMAAFLLINWV